MLTRAKRLGSAAVRMPSMVTSMPVSGTPVSLAYISMRVTPHDETAARNASLFVSASGCGRADESNDTVTPRAALRARPSTPELDDRIVSTLSLTAASLVRPMIGPRRRPVKRAPAAPLLQARIERVAQAVAEQVEAEHRDEDRQPGEERQPGVGLDEGDVGLEVPPPAGRRRLRAEAEEAERGLHDDRGGDAERGGHDDRRQAVGQDVAEEDPRVA